MYYVCVYMYVCMYIHTHRGTYTCTHTCARQAFMHVNTHMCTHIHPFHLKAKINPFASCWLFDHNNEENDVEDGHLEHSTAVGGLTVVLGCLELVCRKNMESLVIRAREPVAC